MIKFPSKYPIIVSAMNQVSYANFAVHCFNAGLMPSISIFNSYRNGNLNYEAFDKELNLFQLSTNSNSIFVSCSAEHLTDNQFLILVKKYDIKYFELIDGFDIVDRKKFLAVLTQLKNEGCKFFIKVLNTNSDHLGIFDGIILKGKEGAGRSDSSLTLLENFKLAREKYPTLSIIPSGGIHSKDQINLYLDNGAPAVSIGTLFVASIECRVSRSFKQELISKNSSDLSRIEVKGATETQQGLIYGFVDNDDENHTFSLSSKVHGGEVGVIFAGKAIDHIDKIRPLSEIVSSLV